MTRQAPRLLLPYRAGSDDVPEGVVIVAGAETFATGDDDASSFTDRPQSLADHAAAVEQRASGYAATLGLSDDITRALQLAARHHDDGKRDPRFQEFLRSIAGGKAASMVDALAKSGSRASRVEEQRLREAANLPQFWRHEVTSARLFVHRNREPKTVREVLDLALWLIGTHHGQGRPFFRHVDPWDDHERSFGGETLPSGPGPHNLDFDWHGDAWTDLFETLKRRYGFWGLAYLEAVLRLADHRASETPEPYLNDRQTPTER